MDPKQILSQLRDKAIIKDAFALLREKLPKTLAYHTVEHSEDVLNEVILLGVEDKLDERSLELLAVAAVYHDSGFIRSPKNNEAFGARFAEVAMEKAGGFSDVERRRVMTMILETQLQTTPEGTKQIPNIPMSCYLCDADAAAIGRDDFFPKAELLRSELGLQSQKEFYSGALQILQSHEWFTPAAVKLRGAKREANLQELKRKLGTMK
ncbi:MAG: hypothetical protein J0M12_11935 [Deltaproteobacteria bacterium]|nr:hypothetical protein [Deltaproteobacteria bacterium]